MKKAPVQILPRRIARLMPPRVGRRAGAFTLLEVLIAVFVLALLMAFLFQFIIGAQRIWSASNRTMSTYETAQLVFDLLETDLRNALCSDEPGREIPIFLWRNPNLARYQDEEESANTPVNPDPPPPPNPDLPVNLALHVGLLSSFHPTDPTNYSDDDVGVFPVTYLYHAEPDPVEPDPVEPDPVEPDPEANKVYRLVVNQDFVPRWFLLGMDTANEDFFTDLITVDDSPFRDYQNGHEHVEVIAEGVSHFDIETLPNQIDGYTTQRPQVVKITLRLYDAGAVRQLIQGGRSFDDPDVQAKIAETEREFTKIIVFQP